MKPRVCAVSYLNTAPLVWGLLHGPQTQAFDLRFEIPSRCADLLRSGEVDIGLVPSIELERQKLTPIAHLGIASVRAVRSILLVSKVNPGSIRRLAVDASSRTSVVLARILLHERYGSTPDVAAREPELQLMLEEADAALVIGDPALRLEGLDASFQKYDLGAEWSRWTGLPMVYAVWAARDGYDSVGPAEVLQRSWEYGSARIKEIAHAEGAKRGIAPAVAEEYLTDNIRFELEEPFARGLALFRKLARQGGLVVETQ